MLMMVSSSFSVSGARRARSWPSDPVHPLDTYVLRLVRACVRVVDAHVQRDDKVARRARHGAHTRLPTETAPPRVSDAVSIVPHYSRAQRAQPRPYCCLRTRPSLVGADDTAMAGDPDSPAQTSASCVSHQALVVGWAPSVWRSPRPSTLLTDPRHIRAHERQPSTGAPP